MNDEGSNIGTHTPVMIDEVMQALGLRPGCRALDLTLGEGGFTRRLLEACGPGGEVLAMDRDREAVERARAGLASEAGHLHLVHDSYSLAAEQLARLGWDDGVDAVVADLGLSSVQLDDAERGFSFSKDGPLDMRMDRSTGATAADLLNELSEAELADIFYQYGEERKSRRVAAAVVRKRALSPFARTSDLAQAVREAGLRGRPGHDPATRTFQALRIAVNSELDELTTLLDQGWKLLRPAGRMAVLSYHSLEDRIVKRTFRQWSADCLCPPDLPVCSCGWQARTRLLGKRQVAGSDEIERNPRARSAGLRVVERITERDTTAETTGGTA